jgi:hypothetical protein
MRVHIIGCVGIDGPLRLDLRYIALIYYLIYKFHIPSPIRELVISLCPDMSLTLPLQQLCRFQLSIKTLENEQLSLQLVSTRESPDFVLSGSNSHDSRLAVHFESSEDHKEYIVRILPLPSSPISPTSTVTGVAGFSTSLSASDTQTTGPGECSIEFFYDNIF